MGLKNIENEEIVKIVKTVLKKYVTVGSDSYEDLYFEGIIEAWKAIGDFNEAYKVKLTTYIYTRVNYKMIYIMRKANAKKRKAKQILNYELIMSENSQEIYNSELHTPSTQEEEYKMKEAKKEFYKEISNILNTEETKYLQDYLNGMEREEIAKKYNLSSRQMSNKVYYIKNKLKENKTKFLKTKELFD